MKTNFFKQQVVLLVGGLLFMPVVFAVDWLLLQGTTPPYQDNQLFGFIQPTYIKDLGNNLSGLSGPASQFNGQRVVANTISPDFDNDEELQIRRLAVGGRGRLDFIENDFYRKIDYFVLFELGKNLITYDTFGERNQAIALDHLSLTFNHIPGVRIRAGLFKTPGPEETFQAIHTLDYIELTSFSATQVVERFVTGNAAPGLPGGMPLPLTTIGMPTTTAYGINAVRDWGVQFFDAFPVNESWVVSYAVMFGNGDAINHSDSDSSKDTYLYLSTEKDLPGGRKTKKHGLKFYTWLQQGNRKFESDPVNKKYKRERLGVGFKFLGWPFKSTFRQRLSAELMYADGMVFVGPQGGVAGNPLRFAAEQGNKSRGLTLDYGFYLNQNWELDIRFAKQNLLYEQAGTWSAIHETVFDELTLGFNYHFNQDNRLTVNYIFREVTAPNASTVYAPAANGFITNNRKQVVESIGDRFAVQYTWIF